MNKKLEIQLEESEDEITTLSSHFELLKNNTDDMQRRMDDEHAAYKNSLENFKKQHQIIAEQLNNQY